jgi:prepilin-type N-terminal cleavage/methylation domain-containing protein
MNKFCKNYKRDGFSLVEVMISILIIVIVALGTMSFQYHGVKHSRSSEAQIAATRLGQLILEDWKSTGGAAGYNPTTLGLGFVTPTTPETGSYKITLDYQTFYLTFAQQLVTVSSGSNPDTVAGVALYQLRVTVNWRKDFGTGATSGSDPTLTFTTFVRKDS